MSQLPGILFLMLNKITRLKVVCTSGGGRNLAYWKEKISIFQQQQKSCKSKKIRFSGELEDESNCDGPSTV